MLFVDTQYQYSHFVPQKYHTKQKRFQRKSVFNVSFSENAVHNFLKFGGSDVVHLKCASAAQGSLFLFRCSTVRLRVREDPSHPDALLLSGLELL